MFTNVEINITQLPATESIDFVPLERRYVRAQSILVLAWMLVIALVAFVVVWMFLPEDWRRGLGVLTVLPVFPVLTYISCRCCGYALRNHDIALRKGIFWRKQSIDSLPCHKPKTSSGTDAEVNGEVARRRLSKPRNGRF